jgi:hypothetical protein
MLGYFIKSTTRTTIATAALFQPGDEAGAYGRTVTPWQRSTAKLAAWESAVADLAAGRIQTGARTAMPIQFFTLFANFQRNRSLGLFALSTFIGLAGAADTSLAKSVRYGAYDGTWNVIFTTRAGNCSSSNSAPFTVSGRRVSSAGGGKVTGGINASGRVSVRISVGRSVASGSGRLAGNSGSGSWSGIISGDRCSGTWRAARG